MPNGNNKKTLLKRLMKKLWRLRFYTKSIKIEPLHFKKEKNHKESKYKHQSIITIIVTKL